MTNSISKKRAPLFPVVLFHDDFVINIFDWNKWWHSDLPYIYVFFAVVWTVLFCSFFGVFHVKSLMVDVIHSIHFEYKIETLKKTLVSMAYKTKRLQTVRWNFIAFIWYSAFFYHTFSSSFRCMQVCVLFLSRSIFGRINKWAHIWKFDFSIHCAPHHIFIKFRF